MRLLILAAAVPATGCVSVQNRPLADAAATSLSGADIARTSRERPSFSAMTAGKAAFGMLGAAAMISAGNDVVTNNNIEDPAHKIADALLSAIAEKHGAEVVEQRSRRTRASPPTSFGMRRHRPGSCSTCRPSIGASDTSRPTGTATG
jgi:hypothetical protein